MFTELTRTHRVSHSLQLGPNLIRPCPTHHRSQLQPEAANQPATIPSLLAELHEEWLALQKEIRRLWSEHKRPSGDADRASAVITLSRSELDRLSLLLRTGISQEDTVLYKMLIQSEQLRLKTAEAKLARSQRLQRAAKEEALESEEYERLAEWAFQAEQTWQSYLHGAKAYATPQTYPESGHLTSRDASSIKAWQQAVEAAFADYANITVFPEPPAIGHCMDASCKHGERKLKACACQIERGVRVPDQEGIPRGEGHFQAREGAVASGPIQQV